MPLILEGRVSTASPHTQTPTHTTTTTHPPTHTVYMAHTCTPWPCHAFDVCLTVWLLPLSVSLCCVGLYCIAAGCIVPPLCIVFCWVCLYSQCTDDCAVLCDPYCILLYMIGLCWCITLCLIVCVYRDVCIHFPCRGWYCIALWVIVFVCIGVHFLLYGIICCCELLYLFGSLIAPPPCICDAVLQFHWLFGCIVLYWVVIVLTWGCMCGRFMLYVIVWPIALTYQIACHWSCCIVWPVIVCLLYYVVLAWVWWCLAGLYCMLW